MNRPRLARDARFRLYALCALAFFAYKLDVLVLLHNSLLECAAPSAAQQRFIQLFLVWSLVTGVALLVLSCTETSRRGRRAGPAVAVAGCLSLAAVLLFFGTAWFWPDSAVLSAEVALVSAPLAVVNYFWARSTVRLPMRPLLLCLAVGQTLASSLFVLFKHASAFAQLACLVACTVLCCIAAWRFEGLMLRKPPPAAACSSDGRVVFDAAKVSYPPVLLGIVASTLGAGILWGSSEVIRSYELWVFGAIAVCLAVFAVLAVRRRPVHADAILRAVFVVLGVAILLAVLIPSLERLFIGLVWSGYTVLSLVVFSTGHLRDEAFAGFDDVRRLGASLACFAAFMGLGLVAGRLVSVYLPGVGTPSLVAVVLLLFSSTLAGRFARNPEGGQEVAAPPCTPCGTDRIAQVVRARCRAVARDFGLSSTEEDTLFLLTRGRTIRQVAQERCVSENTVKTQVSSLYRKLGAHSRLDLSKLLEAVDEAGAQE